MAPGRETVSLGDKVLRIELADFPVVDADLCKLSGGYNREVIELAGGRVWDARKLSCTAAARPVHLGVRLVSARRHRATPSRARLGLSPQAAPRVADGKDPEPKTMKAA